jgi:hypothetical protein
MESKKYGNGTSVIGAGGEGGKARGEEQRTE